MNEIVIRVHKIKIRQNKIKIRSNEIICSNKIIIRQNEIIIRSNEIKKNFTMSPLGFRTITIIVREILEQCNLRLTDQVFHRSYERKVKFLKDKKLAETNYKILTNIQSCSKWGSTKTKTKYAVMICTVLLFDFLDKVAVLILWFNSLMWV